MTWPTAASAVVDLSAGGPGQRVRAAALPVAVGEPDRAAAGAGSAVGRVRVEVFDHGKATAADISGVLLGLSRADGTPANGVVSVEVDYSAFRTAFGGNWASRLTLVRLPACVLTAPQAPTCRTPTRVAGVSNNLTSFRLAGEVQVTGEPLRGAERKAAADESVTTGPEVAVYGVTALAMSPETGDFTKTSLAPSYSWQAGTSGGEFSWSYPMRVPPAPSGLEPDVALRYSSSAVDGRTNAENSQTSWVGEGWDFAPGYVERTYRACKDDTANSPTYPNATGDLCWRDQNATVLLNGRTTELILDDETGRWRLADDDGSRVERLVGGTVNFDDDNEHWRITTQDGTQYWFGLNRLPGWVSGNRETGSVWRAPVFANHAGEPCFRTGGFAGSWCLNAWRWNLDYVVDPHGNTMSYWYTSEVNRTALAGNPATGEPYNRGGWLRRIEYGTRRGTELSTTTPPMQVLFTEGDRCLASCFSGTSPVTENWRDTPWDLHCTAASCPNSMSPSFWTTKRLTKVTTQVLTGSAYTTVDEWALNHAYLGTADGTDPSLWLADIGHTGKVGGSVSLPSVRFGGTRHHNRADHNVAAGVPHVNKWRVTQILNGTGGELLINYENSDCTVDALPNPDNNPKRCFPQYYAPPASPPGFSWWNKYRVTSVVERDLVGGSPDMVTEYAYSTAGSSTNVLWHHDDRAWGAPLEKRSWSDWRGYSTVTVTEGATGGDRSQTTSLYFRGMDADRTDTGEFTRDAKITTSEGLVSEDHSHLAGFLREERHFATPGGQVLTSTRYDPWQQQTAFRQEPTTHAQPSRFWAFYTRTARTSTRTWLAATGTWRTGEVQYEHDPTYGQVTSVSDQGEIGVSGDSLCTTTSYARTDTPTAYLVDYPAEETNTDCTASPAPANILSSTRTYYDGSTTLGAGPTRGLATRVDELDSFSGTTPTYVTAGRTEYDALGRETRQFDALDRATSTAYTPATGPVTSVTVTNPADHVTTTTVHPAWGVPTVRVDPNNKRTEGAYDPLGRLSKVWLPGRTTTQTPNDEHAYTVADNAANSVLTKRLGPNGNQVSTFEIFDGLLRPRQIQTTAPDGKRVIADTAYDSRGLAVKQSTFHNNASAPTGTLASFADPAVGTQRRYTYDGLERVTSDQLWSLGVEKWRTTTSYDGDRTNVDPPDGGTATTTIIDVRGRIVQLRQYHGGSPTGTHDPTSYLYDREGQLRRVTDPAGNRWNYTYDLRGRRTVVADPDQGTTTMTYDAAGQQQTSTDQRGDTLAYSYDSLGRKTAVFDGTTTGPKLAEWSYDTLAKGQLTSSTRFNGGQSYIKAVTGYDDGYRPLGARVAIPAEEPGLGGDWTTTRTYKVDGSLATVGYPAAGGMLAETVTHTYTDSGVLSTVAGTDTYLAQVVYHWDGQAAERVLGGSDRRVRLLAGVDEATRRLAQAQVQTERPGAAGTWDEQLTQLYRFDPQGNVLAIDEQRAGATVSNECYGYDYLRRLTEAWTTTASTCQAAPSQAVVGGPDAYWHSYGYDVTGNRTSEVRHSAGGDVTRTYSYPAAGQAQPHTLRTLSATGAGTATYGYDSAGNTTSRPGATGQQTLSWDVEGHLASVTEGSATTGFVYDADGERLIRRDAGGATLYLGDMEVRRASGGALSATRHYQAGGGTVAVRSSSGGLSWLAADHHGTGQLAVNAGTLAVTRRKSLPFGAARGAAPGSWPSERGFVGGTTDPTGLTHLGAREYDPGTGRFISVDPIIDPDDPQQMNGYTYANNSPVTFSDPDGLRPDDVAAGRASALHAASFTRHKYAANYRRMAKQRAAADRKYRQEIARKKAQQVAWQRKLREAEWRQRRTDERVRQQSERMNCGRTACMRGGSPAGGGLIGRLPTGGDFPFEPKKGQRLSNPKGIARQNGNPVDKYGDEWRWDPNKEEWDVQHDGGKKHTNVGPDGKITHGDNNTGRAPKSPSDGGDSGGADFGVPSDKVITGVTIVVGGIVCALICVINPALA